MMVLVVVYIGWLYISLCDAASWKFLPRTSYENMKLSTVVKDIMVGLPTKHSTLVTDKTVSNDLYTKLLKTLNDAGIMVAGYRLHSEENIKQLSEDIKLHLTNFEGGVYLMMAQPNFLDAVIEMVRNEDLLQRNVVYIYYWGNATVTSRFKHNVIEAMRVCVIITKQHGTFRVFYNQAQPDGKRTFKLVNWWTSQDGLFVHPLLPSPEKVYQDFHERTFEIPVLHKPPWNFVTYHNEGIVVKGGRDDKLLALLASKLNFRYEYFDPPDRSQGSAIDSNGTMKGVLGLIWQRDVELFIGDLTVTYERSQAVEFSFLTLADNEAFLTHAPGRLNEALALVRPFHWKVWPLLLVTIIVSGPLLYFIMDTPKLWDGHHCSNNMKLLCDCIWSIYSIFLRQGNSISSKLHKVRLVLAVLSLAATYVIGDMYSANLTSMLARPARESPISTLQQLEEAMRTRGFQLLVEKYSASHGNVENGTGLYQSIWQMMKMQPMNALIDSAEKGMKLVQESKTIALIGGRETFFYDTRRFGAHNFHLSEKLNTRYSAIALQKGCPYISMFNQILMQLFEAGILSKITEEEYQKLAEVTVAEVVDVAEGKEQVESDNKLKPMNMKALQGAFIVLIIGHCIAGILLGVELTYHKISVSYCKTRKPRQQMSHPKIIKTSLVETKNIFLKRYFSKEI